LLGLAFAILISVGIPIMAFLYACKKRRLIPFLLGMVAFVVSQVMLRIPLLNFLDRNSTDYIFFSLSHPFLFAIFLGLTAGLFEETARFVAMRFFMKQREWQSGFLFGIGHGSIEALIFVGIPVLKYAFTATFNPFGAPFFIGGVERFFAIILHIGLSIIVLQAVVQRKIVYILVAILTHTVVNAIVGILPLYISADDAVVVIEVVLAVVALAVFSYTIWIKRKGIFE
jgi:uncharacterized membrane protein YhfC